jgi:hypothetical protein
VDHAEATLGRFQGGWWRAVALPEKEIGTDGEVCTDWNSGGIDDLNRLPQFLFALDINRWTQGEASVGVATNSLLVEQTLFIVCVSTVGPDW